MSNTDYEWYFSPLKWGCHRFFATLPKSALLFHPQMLQVITNSLLLRLSPCLTEDNQTSRVTSVWFWMKRENSVEQFTCLHSCSAFLFPFSFTHWPVTKCHKKQPIYILGDVLINSRIKAATLSDLMSERTLHIVKPLSRWHHHCLNDPEDVMILETHQKDTGDSLSSAQYLVCSLKSAVSIQLYVGGQNFSCEWRLSNSPINTHKKKTHKLSICRFHSLISHLRLCCTGEGSLPLNHLLAKTSPLVKTLMCCRNSIARDPLWQGGTSTPMGTISSQVTRGGNVTHEDWAAHLCVRDTMKVRNPIGTVLNGSCYLWVWGDHSSLRHRLNWKGCETSGKTVLQQSLGALAGINGILKFGLDYQGRCSWETLIPGFSW